MANRGSEELAWVDQLRAVVPQAVPQPYATTTATTAAYTTPNTSANTSLPNAAEHTDTSTPIMVRPTHAHTHEEVDKSAVHHERIKQADHLVSVPTSTCSSRAGAYFSARQRPRRSAAVAALRVDDHRSVLQL